MSHWMATHTLTTCLLQPGSSLLVDRMLSATVVLLVCGVYKMLYNKHGQKYVTYDGYL
jgi:hypothetical protein